MAVIQDDLKPICVYNAEQQKLVAIFSTATLASKYIYGKNCSYDAQTRIYNYMRNKTRMVKNDLGFVVALRYANSSQVEQLGANPFIVLDKEAKPVDKDTLRSMSSSFRKDMIEKQKNSLHDRH